MTPRELVVRSLEFDGPARIPREMGLLPWATSRFPDQVRRLQERFPDDLTISHYFCREPVPGAGDPYAIGTYVDEWGCTFVNRQAGIIGEVKAPLVAAWEDMEQVREPIGALTVDTSQVAAFCRASEKFVLAPCCPRPFERLQFLRGTENVMMDLASGSDELRCLLDKIHQFYLKEVELWCGTEVDGIVFMDDWGAQRSLLIAPGMWRDVFKPLYREYIDLAHAAGKKIFMHSDGWITDIIDDLVELGLDALNAQVFCMDLEALGARFKGKLTFWGELDRQHLLARGTRDEVVAAVRRFNRCFYDGGGVIGKLEFGPGANPDNIYTAFEAWEASSEIALAQREPTD